MKKGKVITFLSSKGGVGKTVLASNLAVNLAKEKNNETALLDFNFLFGRDSATIFNIHKITTIKDLNINTDARSGDNSLKEKIKPIHGVRVISGIHEKETGKPSLTVLFRQLKNEFDYIIIDMGQGFSGELLSTLDNTSLALVVATPDTLSVNHCGFILDKLTELHFPAFKTRIVLNRTNGKSGISQSDIEKYLKRDIFINVPEEQETVLESINKEIPFAVNRKKTPLSTAIEKMAGQIHSGRDRKGELLFTEDSDDRSIQAVKESGIPSRQITSSDKKDGRDEIIIRVHRQLVKEMDLKDNDVSEALHRDVEKKIGEILDREKIKTSTRLKRISLVKEIMDEVLGLGPLEGLLADDKITEIMVNAPDRIYIEINGCIKKSGKAFIDNHHILRVIERIVTPLGKRIDESSPYVDARLPDGSRVNAIISPLSLEGPTLTIRKFAKEVLSIDNLINLGTIDEKMAAFLKLCVKCRKNVIISGGTGTGKTTLLNIISGFIPPTERIITIEDSAELRLPQEHVIRLEARPPNIEGKGAITIRDLVRNALRMRPDRIVIGECRGGEALDMLQAMNTGHDGSITTVHSNSSRDALSRIETMVLMAGMELPVKAIREQIASAIQLIVQVTRFLGDGSRKITQISEVTGIEQDVITLQDIFTFRQEGIDRNGRIKGDFKNTGFVPGFLGELKSMGYDVDMGMFQ